MIPIQEAIETGAWLEANYAHINDFRIQSGKTTLGFRFRVKNLEKIDLRSVVVDPEDLGYKMFPLKLDIDANVWRLDLDIVNMEKYEIRSDLFGELLGIQDESGNEYRNCQDRYLTLASEYAKLSGLERFFATELPPKIKRSGAFCFELPEFFEQLFVVAREGTIKEC